MIAESLKRNFLNLPPMDSQDANTLDINIRPHPNSKQSLLQTLPALSGTFPSSACRGT